MKAGLPQPTDGELAILQVLWRKGMATVKEVQESLGPETGYTTALKLLQIMTDKGLVQRDESERAHVYRASCSQGETQRQLLRGLLQKAFSGSTSQLVLQALASKRATAAELAEIRRLLTQHSRKKS
jgi:BlaI family penicillinase repressor